MRSLIMMLSVRLRLALAHHLFDGVVHGINILSDSMPVLIPLSTVIETWALGCSSYEFEGLD
jgi:hypothetical protein